MVKFTKNNIIFFLSLLLQKILQNEYASKYLENIGATPSKENMDFVLNNIPIKDALIHPARVRESLVIVPDRIKDQDSTQLVFR